MSLSLSLYIYIYWTFLPLFTMQKYLWGWLADNGGKNFPLRLSSACQQRLFIFDRDGSDVHNEAVHNEATGRQEGNWWVSSSYKEIAKVLSPDSSLWLYCLISVTCAEPVLPTFPSRSRDRTSYKRGLFFCSCSAAESSERFSSSLSNTLWLYLVLYTP